MVRSTCVSLLIASLLGCGAGQRPARKTAETDLTPPAAPFGAPEPVASVAWQPGSICGGVGESRVLSLATDAPGEVCRWSVWIGAGTHVLTLRVELPKGVDPNQDLLTARISDSRETLAAGVLTGADMRERDGTFSVPFQATHWEQLELSIEWSGTAPLRIDSIAVGRPTPALALGPGSGILDPHELLQIEAMTWSPSALTLACNGRDITDRIEDIVQRGAGRRDELGSHTLYRLPTAELLEGCGPRADLVASVTVYGRTYASTRMTVMEQAPPCAFEEGTFKVLVTGFDPFDGSPTNSSAQALTAIGAPPPGASIMPLLLPVEWDRAAAIVTRVVEECHPDAVIALGEGTGSGVELELKAFNYADASGPDNRGIERMDERLELDAPNELPARVPALRMVSALERAGVPASVNEERRPFVCNDVYYRLLRRFGDRMQIGFVHLPQSTGEHAFGPRRLARVVDVLVREAQDGPPTGERS